MFNRMLLVLAALCTFGAGVARGQFEAPSDIQDELWSTPVATATDLEVPRAWVRAEYLMWWSKSGPLATPLVTLGSSADSIPGALGQPGTQVILGDSSIDFRTLNGLRVETGWWLHPDQKFAIESGFFIVGARAPRFSAFSDAVGDPVIARPVINANTGDQDSYLDSFPGSFSGGTTVTNWSQFSSWDINAALNFSQTDAVRWDGLVGFRYLNLTESLRIQDQLFPLADDQLTFLGQPVDASSSIRDFDRFRTANNFYGGQFGTRMTWYRGRLILGALGKVAFGTNRESTHIRGGSALFSPDGSVTIIPGGILATSANIGDYSRNAFAVVPEVNLNAGFQISQRLLLRVGYSFVYWSNVLRPGNQISPVASPTLVPTDPNYGSGGPNQPLYQFHASSYWAQGLNFGVEFNF